MLQPWRCSRFAYGAVGLLVVVVVVFGFLKFFYDLDVDFGFDAAVLTAAFFLAGVLGAVQVLTCALSLCRTLENGGRKVSPNHSLLWLPFPPLLVKDPPLAER